MRRRQRSNNWRSASHQGNNKNRKENGEKQSTSAYYNSEQELGSSSKTGNPTYPLPQMRNQYYQGFRQQNNAGTSNMGGSCNSKERKLYIGFKKLEEWSNKEGEVILIELIGRQRGFEELLVKELNGDVMVLVVKILAKICPLPFKENKSAIINLAANDKFISNLQSYVMLLQIQDSRNKQRNKLFWADIQGFFNNLVIVFKSIVSLLPTKAAELLPKMLKAVKLTMEQFEKEQNVVMAAEIKDSFQTIGKRVDLCVSELERKKAAPFEYLAEQTPPDNFRELSIYPTADEILTNDKPFIRKHIVKGAYPDIETYLDVQFRLLKEDFVAPLREGVHEYTAEHYKRSKRISNVRIHQHVQFLCPRFSKDQVGVLLQFDIGKKKNPTRNYNHSKRFMYGSLLCFTKDNFATLFFGRIIERDPKLLEQNQIVVGFEMDQSAYELNKQYLMIECTVYFEPYYHVLKALQNIADEDFPMKQHLVDVDPHISPPKYLTLEALNEIQNECARVTPTLDDTQLAAFTAAVTQQFVVIQGPPGTGKTYVGLQITKFLIENHKLWHTSTPILVVCFTNHALDQFLEGLIDSTPLIVRIGGQSKNPKLEKYNLKEKRKTETFKGHMRSAIFDLRRDLVEKHDSIKQSNECLDRIHKYEDVIDFRHFYCVAEIKNSWFATTSCDLLKQWLFGGRIKEHCQNEIRLIELEELQQKPEETEEEKANKRMAEMWENQNRIEIDDDFDDILLKNNSFNTYLTGVSQINNEIKCIGSELFSMSGEIDEEAVYDRRYELEDQLCCLEDDLQYLKKRLAEGKKNARLYTRPPEVDYQRPQNMLPDDRWRFYFYCLNRYRRFLINQLVHKQEAYNRSYRRFSEAKSVEDINIMRQMLIVGMTTTGAARLQTSLQALKSPIVIVEEAAEILEAHIITSLTKHCQHLILIGDHKQLRPSTANYNAEVNYNLGISLFERMVNNNIQCHTLGVQHRMRPEIAQLIVPAVYPVLENHSSVFNFPSILGVKPCLFFINHEIPEEEASDFSKLNTYEAAFLIRLARYLVQNGYEPEDITILAAYSGQMFQLWKERNKYDLLLKYVKITVLDNYQGEENKIILLSLVRNNTENRIGFLRIENRVCVALSRAKEGFYMMGNMDILCGNSVIWPKVKSTLESQNALGTSLTLYCQIHREVETSVTTPKDFDKVPEGGCTRICGAALKCGHMCSQLCHIIDRDHITTKCKSACSRILCKNGHQCPLLCFDVCLPCMVLMERTLPCGHIHNIPCHIIPEEFNCPSLVATTLPCGHNVDNKPCFQKPEKFKCPQPCDTRVEPCGHACLKPCHISNDPDHVEYKCYKQCSKTMAGCSTGMHPCPKACWEECLPCEVVVLKSRKLCLHRFSVPCNCNIDEVECNKPCKKELSCGHRCAKKCFEKCGDCKIMMYKILPNCGHAIETKCSEAPDQTKCKGQCNRVLRCGHPCKNKCNQPCSAHCKELVNHSKRVDCGHEFKIHCYLKDQDLQSYNYELLQFCQEPCREELSCKHLCSGTCGKCAQGRFHVPCSEKCEVTLICGHSCKSPCRENCPPCNEKCQFQCKHSKCKKKCGQPCTNCTEKCERRCKHVTCKRKCGEICDVSPCQEPCPKKLRKCNHPCVGFCGDPCPPLCRFCDKEELTSILFGNEDDDDARFVYLEECKHTVESEGMDQWLSQNPNDNDRSGKTAITVKRCPKCNTALTSTQRYSEYVKFTLRDVSAVKLKAFGDFKKQGKICEELQTRINILKDDSKNLVSHVFQLKMLINTLEMNLHSVNKKRLQLPSKHATDTYTCRLQILENIVIAFNEAKFQNAICIKKVCEHIQFLLQFLLKYDNQIGHQQVKDFEKELKRFERVLQLHQIFQMRPFLMESANSKEKVMANELQQLIFSVKVYKDNTDAIIKRKLKELNELASTGIGITDRERQQIVGAMGMTQGHWYKCPNGHIYCITECGGAMQIGKCNECGVNIGGTSHRLLDTNRHAGEMDNSRYAAWSQHANDMMNYEF